MPTNTGITSSDDSDSLAIYKAKWDRVKEGRLSYLAVKTRLQKAESKLARLRANVNQELDDPAFQAWLVTNGDDIDAERNATPSPPPSDADPEEAPATPPFASRQLEHVVTKLALAMKDSRANANLQRLLPPPPVQSSLDMKVLWPWLQQMKAYVYNHLPTKADRVANMERYVLGRTNDTLFLSLRDVINRWKQPGSRKGEWIPCWETLEQCFFDVVGIQDRDDWARRQLKALSFTQGNLTIHLINLETIFALMANKLWPVDKLDRALESIFSPVLRTKLSTRPGTGRRWTSRPLDIALDAEWDCWQEFKAHVMDYYHSSHVLPDGNIKEEAPVRLDRPQQDLGKRPADSGEGQGRHKRHRSRGGGRDRSQGAADRPRGTADRFQGRSHHRTGGSSRPPSGQRSGGGGSSRPGALPTKCPDKVPPPVFTWYKNHGKCLNCGVHGHLKDTCTAPYTIPAELPQKLKDMLMLMTA